MMVMVMIWITCHPNRNDIMKEPFLFVNICMFVSACLYVFAMVSWSENVHLLDEKVYAMLLLHEYMFTNTRDVHHDQLLLMGPCLYDIHGSER